MNLGAGFSSLIHDEDIAEEYSGKWWACRRCTKPDYVVVYWPNEPPRLTVKCTINRYAPFAASSNCPEFVQVPGIEDLWQSEDDPALLARWRAAHPTGKA